MKAPLGTEVDLSPGHIVLDGVPPTAELLYAFNVSGVRVCVWVCLIGLLLIFLFLFSVCHSRWSLDISGSRPQCKIIIYYLLFC